MADGSSWWRRTDSSADGNRSRATGNGEQSRKRESMRFQNRWRGAEQPISTWGRTGQQQQHEQREGCSQISKAAAAKLTTVLRSAVSPLELQHILESNYRLLCPQHVSAALNALGYMKRADRRSVEALLRQILLPALEQQLDESEAAISSSAAAQQNNIWDSRSCAVALTALAALHAHQHVDALDLSHRLVALFLRPDILQQAIPQGISMVASAAAKLKLRLDEPVLVQLLQGLQDAAARSPLQPMHVSQTLWGVATILVASKHVPPQGHMRRLFLQVATLMTDPRTDLIAACKPVEICNTLAAFVIAELPLPTNSYAAALLDRFTAVGSLRTAVPQDLARTLWAAAKLDVEVRTAQCRAIVAAFCSKGILDRAIAQDISNILWALGTMQQQDAITDHELCTLAAALLERAQQHRAAPQEISTTLWGLATLQANLPRELLAQLQEQFRQPHILAAIAEDEGQSLGLVNTLWAAAALHKASLIGASRSWRELQETLQQKQQLAQRDGETNSDNNNDVGDDDVASSSWAAVAAMLPPQYEPILTAEAVQQLTDMLTNPGRVRHLTPCSVGLCLWSTATLGGSLSYQQVDLLVQRFLQPSCQALVLPLNFTNLVWGCIRLGRADVLQAPGILDQLVSAYFAAGAPGGPWAGKTDPLAASMLLWALAHVSAKPHKHRRLVGLSNWAKQRRRWEQEQLQEQQQEKAQQQQGQVQGQKLQQQQQQQQNKEVAPDDWEQQLLLHPSVDGSSALQQEDFAEPKQQQHNQRLHEEARPQKDKYSVSQRTVQRLFGVFLQRDSIAQADPAILSTALYAAALLQHPITLDDLSWILKAFVAKIEAAGASSLAHMLYAVTALQQSALLAAGTSSSSGRGWVLASDRIDVAKANALVPVLVTLAQEFSWKLHYEATSADTSDCVLGLARAVASGEVVSKSCGWTAKHRQQLQEALHGVLVQLHVAGGMLRKLSTDTLIDIVWTCGEMGVVQEQLLEAVCQELFGDQLQSVQQPGSPPQQQQQVARAAADATVSLRPAHSKPPSQDQVGDSLSLGTPPPPQQQQERPENWWQQICSDPHPSQAQSKLLHSTSSVVSGAQDGRAPLPAWRSDLSLGRRMGALECAQVAAALASTNMLTPELWKAVAQKFCNRIGPAGGTSAGGALSFSDDGCEGSATFGMRMLSTDGVTADEGGGILQSIPLLCWAGAVADCRGCEATVLQLCSLLADSSSSSVWSALRQEYLCQLYQVHMWLLDATTAAAAAAAAATVAVGEAAEAPAGDEPTATASEGTPTQLKAKTSKQGLANVLSSQQLAECRAAWYDATVDSSPSAVQVCIAATLQHVPGLRDVKMEVLTSDGCFSIDVAGIVEDVALMRRAAGAEGSNSNASYNTTNTGDGGSASLAVEVDGPLHFLYPSKQLNGESRYRSRALHVRGYAVVRLPWYEWQQVASVRDSKEQHCVAYLLGKIAAVL